MEDDPDDDADVTDPDERDRALAIHEAAHAAVASALGADVLFVVIDLNTGNGQSRSQDFADQVENLAVCVDGCRAGRLFQARDLRETYEGDFRDMRKILARLPEAERRAALAKGYRLANATLKAKADTVCRIADELLARRWVGDGIVRIEGEELAALLCGVTQRSTAVTL